MTDLPNRQDSSSSSSAVTFPKPPTPPLIVDADAERTIQEAPPIIDPPPPYPSRERRTRTTGTRSSRRAAQASGDTGVSSRVSLVVELPGTSDGISPTSPVSTFEDGATESTPLLSPRRRPRTMSHSTMVSTHSIAHTVLSLFQADDVDVLPEQNGDAVGEQQSTDTVNSSRLGIKHYFRPLWRKAYYLPLFHLLFINFFYALSAFLYCFVGTLTGTTLLIALPLGAVICWFNVVGARAFARGEIALQTYFHGPLSFQPPASPYPIFSRGTDGPSTMEAGQSAPPTPSQGSFLRETYSMFTDQTTYQAIFYFLVIKPSITLLLTIALYAVIPVAFVLVVPAPAALRAVKRIGIWQANIALEGLLQPRL